MHPDTLKFYKYVPTKKPKFKDKFCAIPFDTVQIDEDGDVQLCSCAFHMPYTIGNIYQDPLDKIWTGYQAQLVRQSVIDGDFTYCNWRCSHLYNLPESTGSVPNLPVFPSDIKINLDRSCNLSCATCREHVIIEKNSEKIDKQKKLFEEIRQYALNFPEQKISVTPLNSGEIFASHSGLQFLRSLLDFPGTNLQLELTSNGTLINKNRELLSQIRPLIRRFEISIDAASPEIYAKVRGGDWNELLTGLEFLHKDLAIPFGLKFVIQKNNWHEIESFAKLAATFSARVNYLILADWGHWTIDWWHDNNVLDRNKPTFDPVLDQIRRVINDYPKKVSLDAEIQKYLEKENFNQQT